ncbi:hypothetical protein HDU98_005132 [Podochytrium sp. JEL0797]|nr:hypothetical protein HDU98_005132 [Podochytrium sp. JEL0797]
MTSVKISNQAYSGSWIRKGVFVMFLIGFATAIIWIAAILTYRSRLPSFTGLLILAYTLGLRHAMDADHIAAIDNVTRRLIEDGQQPVTVGTFFSLGHSTIVIIATFLVAIISSSISSDYDDYNNVAGYVGTILSATFLILIGTLNGYSAWCTYKEMKRIKNQEVGFETATEISVLAISISAHQSSDSWCILFLLALFTVGMCLVDTMDGIMMSGVYGWSNIHPIKKLFYNFFITMVSMVFALFIASVELLGLVPVDDSFFEFIQYLTDHTFKYLGIGFAVTLILTWVDVTKGMEAVNLETAMEEERDEMVVAGGL